MATSGGDIVSMQYDTLGNMKDQLEQHKKAVARLEAAIAFLEANPGAEALVNSL